MKCHQHLKRTLPFLQVLHKSRDKMAMLKRFPPYVINDIIEVLYNIVHENCSVSKHHQTVLRKKKEPIAQLFAKTTKSARVRHMYKQTGGFLGALIPIITSVLASLL